MENLALLDLTMARKRPLAFSPMTHLGFKVPSVQAAISIITWFWGALLAFLVPMELFKSDNPAQGASIVTTSRTVLVRKSFGKVFWVYVQGTVVSDIFPSPSRA